MCREIAVVYEEINTHLYWISPHFVTPSGLSAFRKELYLSSSSPSLFPHPFFSYLAYQNNYDRKCTLTSKNTYLPNWFLTSLRLLFLKSKIKLQNMKDKNCKEKVSIPFYLCIKVNQIKTIRWRKNFRSPLTFFCLIQKLSSQPAPF